MTSAGDLKACRRGAEWALAAATAHELDLFRALAGGPRSLEALSAAVDAHPRGLHVLLGVLEALELVRLDPEGWRLTGQGRARFVDRDAPDFEGDAARLWLANIRSWMLELEETVRSGEPPSAGDGVEGADAAGEEDEEKSLARFMAAMANVDRALVEGVAGGTVERLRTSGIDPADVRALDLGGGPGTFSRALLASGVGEVVLADRPEVVEHVREAYGLDDLERLTPWAGDFLESLPEGPFGVVLLANITHIYAPATNAGLVERLAGRLVPGGVLAILDFVRGISSFAPLFAVTMLLKTEEGGTYARAEYEAWLEAAGLERVRVASLDEERQLVTAIRPAGGSAREAGG